MLLLYHKFEVEWQAIIKVSSIDVYMLSNQKTLYSGKSIRVVHEKLAMKNYIEYKF
jgi:hypothetical protein